MSVELRGVVKRTWARLLLAGKFNVKAPDIFGFMAEGSATA